MFEWISEQTAIISLYSSNLSVFITVAECVYCAVQAGSLNQTYSFVLKGLKHNSSVAGHEMYSVCTVRLFYKINSHIHVQYISTLGTDKLPFLPSLSSLCVPVIARNIRILNNVLGQCVSAL